ncbi:MAG TPA: hypothetical protein VEH84_19380, partial [Alphaproteobacteria bacterium]|nr:hypothetical protein [Alphaproteobacteria bacterium]
RGAGPGRGKAKGMYHAGRWQDLAWVLEQLSRPLTENGLVLIGYSLGANMLLRFLGDSGQAGRVRAAVAVSAPIDLHATSARMLERRNYVYMRYLLNGMVADAMISPGLSDELKAAARKARNCWEFDDTVVAPRNGFASASDYYDRCQGLGALPRIGVPTLVIHAHDDPWIPVAPYLAFDWASNPKLVPLLPLSGGHVGFHGKNGTVWTDDCILAFLGARDKRMADKREAAEEALQEALPGNATVEG